MITIYIETLDSVMKYMHTQASWSEDNDEGMQKLRELGMGPDSEEQFQANLKRLEGHNRLMAQVSMNGKLCRFETADYANNPHERKIQMAGLMRLVADAISQEECRQALNQ